MKVLPSQAPVATQTTLEPSNSKETSTKQKIINFVRENQNELLAAGASLTALAVAATVFYYASSSEVQAPDNINLQNETPSPTPIILPSTTPTASPSVAQATSASTSGSVSASVSPSASASTTGSASASVSAPVSDTVLESDAEFTNSQTLPLYFADVEYKWPKTEASFASEAMAGVGQVLNTVGTLTLALAPGLTKKTTGAFIAVLGIWANYYGRQIQGLDITSWDWTQE